MSRRGRPLAGFPATLKPATDGSPPAKALLRPQRLLHDAARDAARLAPPSGLGLDSATVRERMVQRLKASGITGELLLAAFAAVPRHVFVDTALANQAYEDTALPIGLAQTISKPSVVARMLSLLLEGRQGPAPLGSVLEIGTGCGYQTALLARLSRRVVSIERLQPLHGKARENLAPFRSHHVRLVWGDGRRGHAPNAPYDHVISAAGGAELPEAWIEQLAEGGRLVAPLHDPRAGGQVLLVLDKRNGSVTRRYLDAVHFVPLESGTG